MHTETSFQIPTVRDFIETDFNDAPDDAGPAESAGDASPATGGASLALSQTASPLRGLPCLPCLPLGADFEGLFYAARSVCELVVEQRCTSEEVTPVLGHLAVRPVSAGLWECAAFGARGTGGTADEALQDWITDAARILTAAEREAAA